MSPAEYKAAFDNFITKFGKSRAIRYLSWDDVWSRVLRLGRQIEGDCSLKIRTPKIYGIPRAGTIVSGLLLHAYPALKLCASIDLADIVVDEIIDTGKTMREQVRDTYCSTAALFYRDGSGWEPDYYVEMLLTDEWLCFPWELPVCT